MAQRASREAGTAAVWAYRPLHGGNMPRRCSRIEKTDLGDFSPRSMIFSLAPRPGLEPGTYGLTVPPPNRPETLTTARFPGFCCLISSPSSGDSCLGSTEFMGRISDSPCHLVGCHDAPPARLHVALGGGHGVMTAQHLNLFQGNAGKPHVSGTLALHVVEAPTRHRR